MIATAQEKTMLAAARSSLHQVLLEGLRDAQGAVVLAAMPSYGMLKPEQQAQVEDTYLSVVFALYRGGYLVP